MLIILIFSTHMQDLQEVTQEVHYENYRSERLAKGVPVPKRTTYDSLIILVINQCVIYFFKYLYSSLPEHEKNAGSEKDRILQEKEAELKRMQDVIAKMQAQIQQQTP